MSDIDLYIRMCLVESLYTFRSSDDAHKFDVFSAVLLDEINSCNCGTASREHRICDNDGSLLDRVRKLAEILMGLVSLLVTVETDMTDLRGRNEGKDTVYHSKTCAEHRDNRQFFPCAQDRNDG